MIPRLLSIILFFVCAGPRLLAQVAPPEPRDTLPPALETPAEVERPAFRDDNALVARDTLIIFPRTVRMSKDSIDYPVDYSSRDSMISELREKRIHLYGDAVVKYTSITLKAAYIMLDYETKIVTAEAMPDSAGILAGLPIFADGDQEYEAKRMEYNFETEKGIVYDVTTKYNDITIHGAKTKFVTQKDKTNDEPGDTTRSERIIYNQKAIFTTCEHPQPHFGIRSTRQKVIPDKLAVIGPSNLEIMGVPTPLWLPFGFFPISKGRSSGLIFPRDYEYSQQWGFGVRDIGWFFPLGEYYNVSLTANLYVKGTWGLNGYAQYRRRYKYNGNLRLGYDSRRNEDQEGRIARTNSFSIVWSHNQDATAHPTNRFGGTINLQTNNYRGVVFNDAYNVLNNQLNSNFSFQKNWTDRPYNFSAAFNHSQNTNTNTITISFPTLQFQTQAIYPFKRRDRTGAEKWYESVIFRYRGDMRNRITATDSTLFSQQALADAQFGVQHDINTGMSFKLLKYFNLNPGFTYREVWYTRSTDVRFDPMPVVRPDTIFNADSSSFVIEFDTLALGRFDTSNVYGFQAYRTYNASLSLTTQIFGTLQFRKGWLRGLRHTIKPNISFNFSPDYLNNENYYTFLPTNANSLDVLRPYSPFNGSIFGPPPASGRQMAIGYGFENIFEAKYFSRKDSVEKKFRLFDNVGVNGNYNFAADSLNFSPITITGGTRFFKGLTNIRMGALFDPYILDEKGRRVNRSAWRETGNLLRFDNATVFINNQLTVGKIRAIFQGKEEEVVEDIRTQPGQPPGPPGRRQSQQDEEDLLSLFENFSINHSASFRWNGPGSLNPGFQFGANSLYIQGSIKMSKYWSLNLGQIGYDFTSNRVTYPFIGFTRDLHCWEMGINTAPQRGVYSFYIRVKPGTLDFLKIPYEQNNADAIRAFR